MKFSNWRMGRFAFAKRAIGEILNLMELTRFREPVEVSFDDRSFAILESHHEEGFFMDWRRDPFSKILIVIGGEGFLADDNQEFAIQEPCLIVLPENTRHRNYAQAPKLIFTDPGLAV